MAYNKSISLYLALYFLSLNLALFSIHGQLIPVIDDQTQTYIVHVANHRKSHLLADEDLETWYKSFLPNTTLDSGTPRLVYSYRHAINGFAARLTPSEVKAMETLDGFLYAQKDEMYHLDTTYTHEFLGLSQPFSGAWANTMLGSGVIIGVIDTGIVPTHPSFNAGQMRPPPRRWNGGCSTAGFRCNNKIIGAKAFSGGANPSPMDNEGHGTHVASTAAGSFVDDAHVLGMARGTASGMAPKAHLAIYKVCFQNGCAGSDTLAAIDQAIADGVDVISMSISGNPNAKLYQDSIAKGSLAAFQKGISTCAAAGNDGPKKNTLSHSAPWVLTVGASSTDRRLEVIIKLGNGMDVHGQSAYQPTSFDFSAFLPLEFPGRYGDPRALYCLQGSLDNINVRGKILICLSGEISDIDKGKVVYAAGGAAMISMNLPQQGYTIASDAHILPAAQVSYVDGQRIQDYVLFSSSTPTAAMEFNHTRFGYRPAPAVASFSSRGPSEMNGDVLKPDVLAPGVNILAAWPSEVGPYPDPFATKTFNFVSGTSMATPHVSGIVALLKEKYKQWSPAAIQSAIITSANSFDLDWNDIVDEATYLAAEVYATGAGQVNPAGAMDPGLVYELTDDDYISYLCGLGYADLEVYWTIGQNVSCSQHKVSSPSDLNYPSIAVSFSPSKSTQTVERTVTNVGDDNEIYRVRIQEPPGVSIYLSTYELRFSRLQQDRSFTVSVVANRYPGRGLVASGKLEWVSDKHVVASPIAVRFS